MCPREKNDKEHGEGHFPETCYRGGIPGRDAMQRQQWLLRKAQHHLLVHAGVFKKRFIPLNADSQHYFLHKQRLAKSGY